MATQRYLGPEDTGTATGTICTCGEALHMGTRHLQVALDKWRPYRPASSAAPARLENHTV